MAPCPVSYHTDTLTAVAVILAFSVTAFGVSDRQASALGITRGKLEVRSLAVLGWGPFRKVASSSARLGIESLSD